MTDDQILDAARSAFVEEGEGATVGSIAARIGVTHSAIHQRFGSKRDLFLRALAKAVPPSEVMALLFRGPDRQAPLHPQLRPLLVSLLVFLRHALPQLLALRAAGVELVPEGSESMPARLREALASWVRAAEAANMATVIDAVAVAEGLLGALEARALNEHLGAVAASDDPSFIDLLLRGLLPVTPRTKKRKELP